MKKVLSFLIAFFSLSLIYSQTPSVSSAVTEKKSAETLKNEALKKETVESAVQYLKDNAENTASASDRRSVLYYAAMLLEQADCYEEASKTYAAAAGITAGDAKNMPKVSAEQLVLCAVRCSLNAGDFENAVSYLNSAVRFSKNEKIAALVNLYTCYAELGKAENYAAMNDTLVLMKAYASMASMKSVKPKLLFTLWYVTDDASYAAQLKKEFPDSMETAITQGTVQLAQVPFWYFISRKNTEAEISSDASEPVKVSETSVVPEQKVSAVETVPEKKSAAVSNYGKQQLGLFREKKNADELISSLKAKGFKAYMTDEKRPSGTTYFLVFVDEDSSGTMGLKLKDAGFECYLVK